MAAPVGRADGSELEASVLSWNGATQRLAPVLRAATPRGAESAVREAVSCPGCEVELTFLRRRLAAAELERDSADRGRLLLQQRLECFGDYRDGFSSELRSGLGQLHQELSQAVVRIVAETKAMVNLEVHRLQHSLGQVFTLEFGRMQDLLRKPTRIVEVTGPTASTAWGPAGASLPSTAAMEPRPQLGEELVREARTALTAVAAELEALRAGRDRPQGGGGSEQQPHVQLQQSGDILKALWANRVELTELRSMLEGARLEAVTAGFQEQRRALVETLNSGGGASQSPGGGGAVSAERPMSEPSQELKVLLEELRAELQRLPAAARRPAESPEAAPEAADGSEAASLPLVLKDLRREMDTHFAFIHKAIMESRSGSDAAAAQAAGSYVDEAPSRLDFLPLQQSISELHSAVVATRRSDGLTEEVVRTIQSVFSPMLRTLRETRMDGKADILDELQEVRGELTQIRQQLELLAGDDGAGGTSPSSYRRLRDERDRLLVDLRQLQAESRFVLQRADGRANGTPPRAGAVALVPDTETEVDMESQSTDTMDGPRSPAQIRMDVRTTTMLQRLKESPRGGGEGPEPSQ